MHVANVECDRDSVSTRWARLAFRSRSWTCVTRNSTGVNVTRRRLEPMVSMQSTLWRHFVCGHGRMIETESDELLKRQRGSRSLLHRTLRGGEPSDILRCAGSAVSPARVTTANYTIRVLCSAQYRSRRTRLYSFPVGSRGNSGSKSIDRGHLGCARCSRQKPMSSRSVSAEGTIPGIN